MSTWFSITLAPVPGSLAAVGSALAAEGIAVEGIVGSPESGDGVVHLAVEETHRDRAVAALATLGVTARLDEGAHVEASGVESLIGAILNGPRT